MTAGTFVATPAAEMNRCPACGAPDIVRRRCARCGFEPVELEGFLAYAPELAAGGPGYDPRHFEVLASLEAEHFWFQARNQLILSAFAHHFRSASSYLEVGCGTGFVLQAMSTAFPSLAVSASELFVEGLRFASLSNPRARLFQMDATRLPFDSSFDVIGAFDVLEHIEDDARAAAELFRATKTGGGVVLTVPQHAWLWSAQDEAAHHCRRYRPGQLEALLVAAGFRIADSQSFVSLLLPAMLAVRRLGSAPATKLDPYREFRLPRWLNHTCRQIMRVELALIEAGSRFPVGGSRLVVARKT